MTTALVVEALDGHLTALTDRVAILEAGIVAEHRERTYTAWLLAQLRGPRTDTRRIPRQRRPLSDDRRHERRPTAAGTRFAAT